MKSLNNRLDMLKQLSVITDDIKQLNIFSSYIPDHYDEIYTLYNLLDRASLHYVDIKFDKPIVESDKFTFVCRLSDCDYTKLKDFIKSNDNNVKFMRNRTFNVTLNKNKNDIYIIFK